MTVLVGRVPGAEAPYPESRTSSMRVVVSPPADVPWNFSSCAPAESVKLVA